MTEYFANMDAISPLTPAASLIPPTFMIGVAGKTPGTFKTDRHLSPSP
jgi:hypothetical protein